MPCPYTLLPDVFSVFFGLTPPCKDNDPDNTKKTGIRDKARTNDHKIKRQREHPAESDGSVGSVGSDGWGRGSNWGRVWILMPEYVGARHAVPTKHTGNNNILVGQ